MIFLDTRADIVQLGQQRADNALRILLFIESMHSHVATAFAEAAKKQKNVFNTEIGVSEHTHALLHVLQNVERHRRPGIRCNEKENQRNTLDGLADFIGLERIEGQIEGWLALIERVSMDESKKMKRNRSKRSVMQV